MDTQKRLTRAEAAARMGVRPRTIWNWIRRGVLVGDTVVYLEAERCGAHHRIWPEALERFKRECQRASPRELPPTPRQDRRALERAEASLDRRGCR